MISRVCVLSNRGEEVASKDTEYSKAEISVATLVPCTGMSDIQLVGVALRSASHCTE